MHRKVPLPLLVATTLLLSACAFVDNDQPSIRPERLLVLEPNRAIGQTFVAQHGGLKGIEVWLEPEPDAHGVIVLRLREDFTSSADLAVAELLLSTGSKPGFYRFDWRPQIWSHGVYRYAFLTFSGAGSVHVGAAEGEQYVNGAAYQDHRPLDTHQLTFRLIYDPVGIAIDLTRWLLESLVWVGAAVLLFVVPGYAVLVNLQHFGDLPFLARFALASSLSVAFYPLLMLWTHVFKVQLGPLYAYLPTLLGLVALAYRSLRKPVKDVKVWIASLRARSDLRISYPTLFTVLAIALIVLSRLLVVRSLAAPMWGDSYQHSLITQLIVDNGGLFRSWEPYIPLSTFTYHFGFHALMAVFAWMTGLQPFRAVLLGAQLVNVLAVITPYLLTLQITKNRWSAALTLLIAGLLLPMPAYYVNWGRYTQLTGQVLLPAFVFTAMQLGGAESATARRVYASVATLLLSGLLLTHYRVSMWALVFLAALVASVFLLKRMQTRVVTVLGLSVLLFSFLLTLPWWFVVAEGNLLTILSGFLSTPSSRVGDFIREYNSIGDLSFYMPTVAWLLLLVSTVYGLFKKNRMIISILIWAALLVLATNPDKIGLPGTGAISNFAILIALYLIAAPMISFLVVALLEGLSRFVALRPVEALLRASFLPIAVLALSSQLRIVDVRFMLVTYPDLKALNWIKEYTPQSAKFLIDSFIAYGGSAVVGSDAGWWIPLLSRRESTVPPLVYVSEKMSNEHYKKQLEEVYRITLNPRMYLESFISQEGVDFAYVGQLNQRQGHGIINNVLNRSEEFEEVYRRDRVIVLRLRR